MTGLVVEKWNLSKIGCCNFEIYAVPLSIIQKVTFAVGPELRPGLQTHNLSADAAPTQRRPLEVIHPLPQPVLQREMLLGKERPSFILLLRPHAIRVAPGGQRMCWGSFSMLANSTQRTFWALFSSVPQPCEKWTKLRSSQV